jgi:glycosyltransferase involved in cell wall biosynthesis
MKVVYIFSDKIVTNSKGAAEELKKSKILKNKVFTIYNPIAVDFIKQKSREPLNEAEKMIFDNCPTFINVGRLTEAKGQWQLLRIYKKVKADLPNAKLIIVGDGKLRDCLVNYSKKLGLKTFTNFSGDVLNEKYDVYFLGSQENPFKYMKNSSVFIFSSIFEGFPNAILEALACNIPVISADCRFGPREILAPKTDYRFETKTPDFAEYGVLMPVLGAKQVYLNDISAEEAMWAQTMVMLWKDKKLSAEYAQKSAERVKDLNFDSIISQWKAVVRSVSGE